MSIVKLKTLLEEISGYQVFGSPEISLKGISSNSKLIAPGFLFIAKKGAAHDGRQFIAEAVNAGAAAIALSSFDPSLSGIVQLVHPDLTMIEAALTAAYYQHPSQELFMAGITGTNGKTTSSFIVKSLLDKIMGPCGLIGTIEYIIGPQRHPATHTTPDVISNHRMLRDMCAHGCRSAVMEVSSHGLVQQRVGNIDFDAAVFTNLTLDHLDYHGSMEEYCAAKNRLFRMLGSEKGGKPGDRWAIVNQDSPWTPKILEGCSANILSYGIKSPALLQASNVVLSKEGTRATVTYQGETVECMWSLVGLFNVYNCLAAMGVALTRGISLPEIVPLMTQLPAVRGRLEPVANTLGLTIYVDYAHTDDALLKVLETLKALKKNGRLIVVFGCGGDRDPTKRPKMAQACEQYADFSILTSDNPRSEDPMAIIEEAVKGFAREGAHCIEPDRRAAIQKAVEMAGRDDIILIAGKGHETKQIFANETIVFDDRQVAAECCACIERVLQNSKRQIFGSFSNEAGKI